MANPVKLPCGNPKCHVSPAKEAEAKTQEQLSSALRVQHAYRVESEVSKAKMASLEQSNRLLESKLCAAERSIAYRIKLLAKTRDERDDLKAERMCVLCWERQSCALLLSGAHYPMCVECLHDMTDALSGESPLCPMCREVVTSDLELSPGAPPWATRTCCVLMEL